MRNGTEIVIIDGPLSSNKVAKAEYRTARSSALSSVSV